MYFASEQVHVYMNKQDLVQCYKTVKLFKTFVNIMLFQLVFVCVPISTFNIIVKVAILSKTERLFIRNHALCLMLRHGSSS